MICGLRTCPHICLMWTVLLLSFISCVCATRTFYPGTVVRDYFEENVNRLPLDWTDSLYVSRTSFRVAPLDVKITSPDYEESFNDYPPKAAELQNEHLPFYSTKRLPDTFDIEEIPRPLVVQFGAKMPINSDGYYSEGNVAIRLFQKKEDKLAQECVPQDDYAVLLGVVFSMEGEYIILELQTNKGYVGTTSHLFLSDGDGHSYTLELSEPLRNVQGKSDRHYKILRDEELVDEGLLSQLNNVNECGTLGRKQSYFYGHNKDETSIFEYDYSYPKNFQGVDIDLNRKYGNKDNMTKNGIKLQSITTQENEKIEPNLSCLSEICGFIKAPLKKKDDKQTKALIENINTRFPECRTNKIDNEKESESDVTIVHPVDHIALEAISSFGELSFGGIFVGVDVESAAKLRGLTYAPGVQKNVVITQEEQEEKPTEDL